MITGAEKEKGLSVKGLRFHILGWIIFIGYEILFVVTVTGQASKFYDYLFHYIVNIGFFYFHAYYAFPFILKNNSRLKYLLVPILIALELVFYIVVMIGISYLLIWIEGKPVLLNQLYFIRYTWRGIYFIFFGTAFYYVLMALNRQKRVFELEREQINFLLQKQIMENKVMHSENAWRQAQLNPHFLFNTLNLIYNKVSTISDEIGDSIMMLSQIMRFSISPLSTHGKIKLSDEIEHIGLFIKLNQLRFDDRLTLKYEVSGEGDDVYINPLLLITLVENLFKYGDLYSVSFPAEITIAIKDGVLNFQTRNTIVNNKTVSHGIGLNNVKERLISNYPGKHEFSYNSVDNIFALNLKIILKSDDNLLHY